MNVIKVLVLSPLKNFAKSFHHTTEVVCSTTILMLYSPLSYYTQICVSYLKKSLSLFVQYFNNLNLTLYKKKRNEQQQKKTLRNC